MCKTVVRSALPFFSSLFLAWHTCHCNQSRYLACYYTIWVDRGPGIWPATTKYGVDMGPGIWSAATQSGWTEAQVSGLLRHNLGGLGPSIWSAATQSGWIGAQVSGLLLHNLGG